jgi:hypothetical protein
MKTMLEEMGGKESMPEAGDTIDMVIILRELTLPDMFDYNSRGKCNSYLYSNPNLLNLPSIDELIF